MTAAFTPDDAAREAFGGGGTVEVMHLDSGADQVSRLPRALSPSRASDFQKCPRQFFYQTIAGMQSPPTEHTAVGTVAHSALEHLFDLPRLSRTPEAAEDLVEPAWRAMLAPDLSAPEFDPSTVAGERARDRAVSNAREYQILAPAGSAMELTILERARAAVRGWFDMEDPTTFDPQEREWKVFASVRDVPLLGILDRVDRWESDGTPVVAVSDYKTGKPPRSGYERDAFFGMLTYAALMRATTGKLPDVLRLLYVSHGRELSARVDQAAVDAQEELLARLWGQMHQAARSGVWPTQTSRLCDWCPFQKTVCTAFNPNLRGKPVPDAKAPAVQQLDLLPVEHHG